ncbi:hypothetical protein ABL78_4137 [Leptomonas seymouri]|uniref:Vasohibin-like protein n=1 Tax=Leptomonas seymouri TaxID=5684 RepID=A0A0N1IKY3_LEPSE|nr:hypothetical protein ABL78_4137 [Leptomonas seymouri]|eukprot:KPI86813.1 hypothetical protein ABL78_4137 [Leptomonas seymouri]
MADKVLTIIEQLSQQNPFNGVDDLEDPPRPSEAAIPRDRPSLEQIPYIQQQINILTYNHLPRTFFSLEKRRSLQSILMTAKEALAEALPIRCLEATFVALFFTQCLRDIDRIPLSFKSEAKGNTYRHIVLILRTRFTPSLYGALGLSRKTTLMYKPMVFRSLFDVVMDYNREYAALGHKLVDIKLGIPITHDEHSRLEPCWRFIAFKLNRYCRNTTGSGAAATEAPGAVPSTIIHRKHGSPNTLWTRKNEGQSSETFSCASNDDGTGSTPSLSNLGAQSPGEVHVPFTRGDGHQERFHNGVWSDSQNGGPSLHQLRMTALATSTSVVSPRVPQLSATTATGIIPSRPDKLLEMYAPLEKLLSNYTRLLPAICEQYYKTIGTVDSSNRGLKLCYMDLDAAEKDAGIENQRRLQYISELQSPLSPDARRVAANRQLRSAKKDRGCSKQLAASPGGSGDGSGAKRRQASSNEGRSAKRRSPASPGLTSIDAKRTTVPASSTTRRNHSPRTRLAPITPGVASAATTIAAHSGAAVMNATTPAVSLAANPALSQTTTLAAALAGSGHSLRNPLAFKGTTVDAHSISSSTEVEQTTPGGFVTPLTFGHGAVEGEGVPDAPPLTPRNYDARNPTTPYDAFLCTPSSTSDLFSGPTSLENTMSAQLVLSP